MAAKLLADRHWLDGTYFPTNLSRLEEAYTYVRRRLENLHVPSIKATAGLFVWIDLSGFLESQDRVAEMSLFHQMFEEEKVYLVPGSEFQCHLPGWFRMVFSLSLIHN